MLRGQMASPKRPIATQNEGPLHAALKSWYRQPGDRLEVPVDGRQIDLVRGPLLIEIQTSSFASLRRKLQQLLELHSVRLVHPVTLQKWIVRTEGQHGKVIGRRKSPRTGRLEDVFYELVSLAPILSHPRFSLEIVLTNEDEVRKREPGRAWRRKGWVVVERRLLEVVDSCRIVEPHDLLGLLPSGLTAPFSTADISQRADVSRNLAQKMAYCLREAGVIDVIGKQGNARLYGVAA